MSENNTSEMNDIQRIARLEQNAKNRNMSVSASELEEGEVEIDDYKETNIPPELRKDIEAVLNVMVRPKLAEEGGNLEIVYLDDEGVLWIRMLGQCAGCPSADETASHLIEKELVSRIDKIRKVEIDNGLTDDIIADALSLLSYRTEKKETDKE